MPALETPKAEIGMPMPDFELPSVDDEIYTAAQLMGKKGLVVAFICNHCPFVKAIQTQMVADAKALAALGVNFVAINSNDTLTYPEDSFENMQKVAARHDYSFPYLFDESQAIAKAYDAVCTPDFFGFNNERKLQYRGRLDASGPQRQSTDLPRDLVDAMRLIATTGKGPESQFNSIGCSIKWR